MASSPTSWAAIRDLLLPGLRIYNAKGGPELDLQINFATDVLLVKAAGIPAEPLFSRHEIEDNSWRQPGVFQSRLDAYKAKAGINYASHG